MIERAANHKSNWGVGTNKPLIRPQDIYKLGAGFIRPYLFGSFGHKPIQGGDLLMRIICSCQQ